ncbi:DUF4249 domain-containing protein [Cellulophaga omnivescoria]|uniref:DUF4249 domain-containing protein n=1 Tax=Cellulophaga omnivescoria TaxID=1888890 RepID=UPI000986AB25|nr:DUF4249 domain-containing protein [Cellulophaga omnivescoria]WBU88924.1 DUF4249 domain-containing protein [Cellulophaga omnivescoria]WKB80897.1 DUF4249 domain-containing protein [Cellulophaga lytica]
MKNYIIKQYRVVHTLLVLCILLIGCIEEFTPETKDYESLLVVEAVLTDEYKYQKVKLSRTFKFEEEGAKKEEGAEIFILDNLNNKYNFSELEPGEYVSDVAFKAEKEEYQLFIKTANGKEYVSSPNTLSEGSGITNLFGKITTNSDKVEGVSFVVNVQEASGDAKYYRYEYEETHKIIAPWYRNRRAVIVSENPPQIEIEYKSDQIGKICYSTAISSSMIIASTEGLNNGQLVDFPIRFLERDDYKISNRYSILAKQYVISREAHTFYKTLNDLSSSESLFSQIQPGFLKGNIENINDESEKVIGFFEVSSVSSKRIFFEYNDIFTDEVSRAKYPFSCSFIAPEEINRVINIIKNKSHTWVTDEPELCSIEFCPYGNIESGPNVYVSIACGDCTVFSSSIVPDFWED